MERTKITISIVGAIVSIITLWISYKKDMQNQSGKEKYYNNILIPFIRAFHENENRNWYKFIKKITNKDDRFDFLPTYYLEIFDDEISKEEKSKKIRDILLYDYIHMRKNTRQEFAYFNDKMSVIIGIILTYVVIFFVVFISFVVIVWMGYLILVRNISILPSLILLIVLGGVLCLALKFLILPMALYDDMYSLKIKEIKKQIKIREKWMQSEKLKEYKI